MFGVEPLLDDASNDNRDKAKPLPAASNSPHGASVLLLFHNQYMTSELAYRASDTYWRMTGNSSSYVDPQSEDESFGRLSSSLRGTCCSIVPTFS